MNKNMLGVMLDNSRGAVMKVDTIKDYAFLLSKMGYNTLMLYTEETYEIDSEPLFGFMRGRYTADEIKELDSFCSSIGIELVPCIQTLAHLENIFRFPEYEELRDCDDILLAEEEKTYILIEKMFATCRQNYTTNLIHIGMDEAHRVGLGNYLERHGYQDRFGVINRHLHRVCKIAEKYGFKPMIWHDMFIKLAGDGNIEDVKNHANLPDNVTLVYWDYYSRTYQKYADIIDINLAFDKPVIFAGGAWTWRGFAPDNRYSIASTKAAFTACKDKGINDVLLTSWGDGGSECSKYAILPTLMYAAELYRGNDDIDSIKAKFKDIVGADFDDVLSLDKPDQFNHPHADRFWMGLYSPSKFSLYNDPFIGLDDNRCEIGMGDYYATLEAEYHKKANDKKFGYLFNMYANLCAVLKYKSDLSLRLRRAYHSGDKTALKNMAEIDCENASKNLDAFYQSFKTMWFSQNKSFGFEIHENRIGGLKLRIISCKERLLEYVSGKVDSIPELEGPSIYDIRNK